MSSPLLPLVDGVAPPLPLLLRWCERIRAAGADHVTVPHLPDGNGVLPDALRLGGIDAIDLGRDDLPPGFRWEGLGGARVTVGGELDGDDLPLHAGNLPAPVPPADAHDPAALYALLDLARLEDATGILDGHGSATWDHLLSTAGFDRPLAMPPLAARTALTDPERRGVWNPLPFARRSLAALPAGDGRPPWALIAGDRKLPVQVAEGPLGRELLVSLPLGALQAVPLTAHDESVAEPHWEVTATVIDNGLLRAELDALGQVVRLCWDGMFADLTGPAVAPRLDGLGLGGTAVVTVVEAGPVRGKIAVERTTPAGVLHLTYTVHAHEDILRIAASWTGTVGDEPPVLDHPTGHRFGDLLVAGDGGRWSEPARASVIADRPPVRGVRWAALGDAGGRGCAVVAARPLAVRAEAGRLEVAIEGAVHYALAAPRRGCMGMNLGQLSQHLGCPGRPYGGTTAMPAAIRWGDLGGLTPLWARRPEHGGWSGEILVAEQAGSRGRAQFYPATTASEAWRVDAAGRRLAPLTATPEGDGFQIDYGPGELSIIAWR